MRPRSGGLVPASALQTSSRAFSLGLQAVHFAIVARLLAPDAFAGYIAALALFGIFGALADFGLLQTTVLELNRHRGDERRTFAAALRASGILSIASVATAALVTVLLLPREVRIPAVLLLPAFLVVRAQLPFLALRQHQLRFRRLIAAETTGRLLAAASLGVLFLTHPAPGTTAALTAAAASTCLGGLLTLALLAARPGQVQSPDAPRPRALGLLCSAVPLGLTNAASFVHFRVDQVLLAALGVTIGLAEYGIAYRGLEAALGLVTAIGVVVLPLLAQAGRLERTRLAVQIENMLAGIAILLGMLVFAFAPLATSLLGGDRYPEAAWYLRLLAPAVVVAVINLGYAHVAIVEGRHRPLLAIASLSLATNVALNLILIPHFGVQGAVISTLTTELMGALMVAVVASRSLPGSVRLGRAGVAFGGFLVACFGGLAAWNHSGSALGALVAVAGAVVALAPLTDGIVQLFRPRDDRASTESPVAPTVPARDACEA